MYNLIKYSDNYLRTAVSLWKYYIDELDQSILIVLCLTINKKQQVKQVMMVQKRSAKIMVSLKYLSNFWRTLEISLVKCEIKLILT